MLVISACVLALEVALTRIFSAVLRYHFVFLVISVAVCGLGVGGMLTHSVAQVREVAPGLVLISSAAGFGFSALVFVVVLLKLILAHWPDALLLIAALILVPFVFAGMFLAAAFRRYASSSGLLYAYDLCGAASASVGVVAMMQSFGALNAYLVVALLACVVAFVGLLRFRHEVVIDSEEGRPALATIEARLITTLRVLVPTGLFMAVAVVASNLRGNWLDIPPIPSHREDYAKPLYAELADKSIGSKIIHSEWDAFARTDVVEDPQAGKDMLLIYTNGHVPTNIMRYDANKKQYAHMPVVAEVPFQWRPPERVLCIGPGAGLDLLIAKSAGAKKVDGVEVNPAIPRILQMDRFRKFGGDPYHLPGVNVVVGDGRTFALRSRETYDLIFMALTKTATSSAGLSLVEGYIYTLEAFDSYWDRLSPRGQLVFVTDGLPSSIRLFNTALAMLMKRGLSLPDAVDRVALLSAPTQAMGFTPYQYASIISKTTIRGRDGDRLFRTTRRAGYQEVFIPGEFERPPFTTLRSEGATLASFSEQVSNLLQENTPADTRHAINLMPVSDDSPFFLDLTFSVPPRLVPLFFVTLLPLIAFLAWIARTRLRRGSDVREVRATLANALYFACLGVGFMMIEIPLMQKLILVLGHPTLALTVVLFALLLGGGIGSSVSQRVALERLPLACASVAAIAAACALYLRAPHSSILQLSLFARIAWAGALSGVLGIALGMPFPLGLRALASARSDDIPVMWGVNGITSVLGSLLAAVGAKLWGFNCVFFGGVTCYLLAAALRRWTSQRGNESMSPRLP